MKRTKNMVYKPSDDVTELYVYAADNRNMRRLRDDILANLRKHDKKGRYDSDRAVDSQYHYMTLASKEYYKDFGHTFSVAERFTAAIYMEEDMRECMREWVME